MVLVVGVRTLLVSVVVEEYLITTLLTTAQLILMVEAEAKLLVYPALENEDLDTLLPVVTAAQRSTTLLSSDLAALVVGIPVVSRVPATIAQKSGESKFQPVIQIVTGIRDRLSDLLLFCLVLFSEQFWRPLGWSC